MVTSSLAMRLFSQGGKGDEFRKGRPSSRCTDSPAINSRVPRLVANRERHERRRVEFDHVGRGSSGVTQPLDDLNSSVRWNAHLDRLAWGDAREFLQDEPHCYGGGIAVCGPVPN